MIPEVLEPLERETTRLGFSMPSDRRTGELLRVLAATKPQGRLLELGTGTGLATSWMLDGMDSEARLDTLDNDAAVVDVARRFLGADERVTFHLTDGERFITDAAPETYDLVFADAWPGKYSHLDETIALLKQGGIYVIDDMNPQPNWPSGHEANVRRLLTALQDRRDLFVCPIDDATGLVICARAA